MRLPSARGEVSERVIEALRRPPHDLPAWPAGVRDGHGGAAALTDEDLQITLFTCYELHYRGFDGVDDGWEWNPSLLALRAAAERRLRDGLRDLAGPGSAPAPAPGELPRVLAALVAADGGPSLSRYLQRSATVAQFREFVAHRSVYQLKEADPQTWAIPRLDGRPKSALVEIQADEYGGGRPGRTHAELFGTTMDELGLDSRYGAYVDLVPASTLALSNVMSLFGLHRRWRGALIGHLAVLEMDSTVPNRRYGGGLRRLGGSRAAARYYDEHVEADAVHEQLAAHDLCGGYAEQHPEAVPDVLFGARCCLAVERLFATHLLDRWQAGRSSLRAPIGEAAA
ncbi:MAG: iron-containing redox enzyme family protein [Mycobacteriales bacterium]